MKNTYFQIIAATYLLLFVGCNAKTNDQHTPPNVLFIAIDDLRPELGCYGASHIHSPNIDKLANTATLFSNSYCNIPVCGASRASLLTGLRPTLTRFKKYFDRADEQAPGIETLPGLFKKNGYQTISNGKIFHIADDSRSDWDEVWRTKGKSSRDYTNEENIALDQGDQRGPPTEIGTEGDDTYLDGKMVTKSIEDLKRLKASGKPFFLATGFLKPHLPFNAPKKYWDLYDPKMIQLPENRIKPGDVPAQAWHTSGELRHYHGVPEKGAVDDEMAKRLIHGYYACVSYTDALVGRLLSTLEELDLNENTIIILWGDHGWNLYEHGLWCKHSNYRTSLKAPLIIKTPGQTKGSKPDEMVEFVDIFPTLADLCNLPAPIHLEGNSLTPIINNTPERSQWKTKVQSVWHNGFTYTSKKYAYTEWRNPADSILARMLFDHEVDPDENINIIGNDDHRNLIEALMH